MNVLLADLVRRIAGRLVAALNRCEGRHQPATDNRWPAPQPAPVTVPKPDPYHAARLANWLKDPRHNGRRFDARWAELDINQIDAAMREIEAHWNKEH